MSSSPGSIMLKCTPTLAAERGRAKEINNVCVGLCKMGSDQRAHWWKKPKLASFSCFCGLCLKCLSSKLDLEKTASRTPNHIWLFQRVGINGIKQDETGFKLNLNDGRHKFFARMHRTDVLSHMITHPQTAVKTPRDCVSSTKPQGG